MKYAHKSFGQAGFGSGFLFWPAGRQIKPCQIEKAGSIQSKFTVGNFKQIYMWVYYFWLRRCTSCWAFNCNEMIVGCLAGQVFKYNKLVLSIAHCNHCKNYLILAYAKPVLSDQAYSPSQTPPRFGFDFGFMNSLLSFGYAFGLWLWIWFRLFVIRFGERFPFLRFHKPQKAGTNASLALFLLFAVDQNAIKNVRVRKNSSLP